jgi:hypothetical protein
VGPGKAGPGAADAVGDGAYALAAAEGGRAICLPAGGGPVGGDVTRGGAAPLGGGGGPAGVAFPDCDW